MSDSQKKKYCFRARIVNHRIDQHHLFGKTESNKLEMYIPELIIAEKFRRLGIGRELIYHCTKLAKQNNCHRIRLESGSQRMEAHEFYKTAGFTQRALSFTKNIA